MLQEYPIKAQGKVKIESIENNTRKVLYHGNNAILPNSNRIIAHLMGGSTTALVDTIEIYDGLNLLASGTTTNTHNAPVGGPYKATITTIIPAAAFSGSYDYLKMASASLGEFSEFTLPSPLTKTLTQQLAITWEITFI